MIRRMMSLVLGICLLVTSMPLQAIAETMEETVVLETAAVETTEPETTMTETTVPETAEPAVPETTVAETAVPETTIQETTIPEITIPEITIPEITIPETVPEVTVEEEVTEEAAATLIVSGYCGKGGLKPGENLQYAFYSDGALYITGYGEMKDYATVVDIPPWGKTYANDYPLVTSVSLPEGLTRIGNCAFYGSAFTSVEIPSTVVEIGTHAFYSNVELQKVTMPDGLVSIGEYAFMYNSKLEEITWPASLVEIGNSAFDGCHALKAADIPNVINLGTSVFSMCKALEACTLSESLKYIPEHAFFGCHSLKSIHIPGSVLSIGNSAFQSSGLETVTVPGNVTTLGQSVFMGCSNLKEANISFAVKDLPYQTFYNCSSLETVFCSNELESIGDRVFYGCTALLEFTIPETVKSIGSSAFYNCRSLTEMTIPVSADKTAPRVYGEYIFSGCSKLKKVTILDAMTAIPNSMFSGCNALETLLFPAEEEADDPDGDGFMENKLPRSVTSIGNYAFYVCETLKEITFPETLASIGNCAFQYCDGLTAITIPESVTQYGYAIFRDCTALKDVTLPQSMTAMPNEMFCACESIEEIELPENLAAIGNCAFQRCEKLGGITLPGTLTTIGENAFSSCYVFTEVEIPDSVTSIGKYAFLSCQNLENVKLPVNGQFTVLADGIFDGCYKLAEIDLPDTIVSIGSGAFRSTALTEIDFPASIRVIGIGAFQSCKGFLTFEFPENVEKIDSYTFSGCTNLQNIIIPKTVTAIDYMAFNDCKALQDVYYGGTLADWGAIVIGYGNDVLKNAKMHYGGSKDSGKLEDGRRWVLDIKNSLIISGEGAMKDYTETQQAPWQPYCNMVRRVEIREGITHIGDYSFENFTDMEVLVLPESLQSIGAYAFRNCTSLERILYYGSMDSWDKIDIGEGNMPPLSKDLVESVLVDIYGASGVIEIHGGGTATAYFRTKPNTKVVYRRDGGESETADSGPEGVFGIPLEEKYDHPDYDYPAVTVEFLEVGGTALAEPITETVFVKVKPLSYSQKWSVSFDKGLAAEPEVEVDYVSIEGGLNVNLGTTLSISREFEGEKENLKLSSDRKVGAGLGAGISVGADAEYVEFTLATGKAEASGEISGTYGIELENYSPYNPEQRKAIGMFLLKEISLNINDPTVKACVAALDVLKAKEIYDAAGCTIVEGSSTGVNASVDLSIGEVKVGGESVLATSLVSDAAGAIGSKFSVSYGNTVNSKNTREKSAAIAAETALRALTILDTDALLYHRFLSTDIEVTAKLEAMNHSLEATALNSDSIEEKRYGIGKTVSSDYDQYIFQGSALDELTNSAESFNHYMYGVKGTEKNMLSVGDINILANVLSANEVPVQYNQVRKDEMRWEYSRDIPIADILNVKLGISGLDEMKYVTASGFALDDHTITTAETDESIKPAKKEFWDLFKEAIAAIGEDVRELTETEEGDPADGVEITNVQIAADDCGAQKYLVTLSAVRNTGNAPASYALNAQCIPGASAQKKGIIATGTSMEQRNTVGSAAVVSVSDYTTRETVLDFADAPMRLAIRYTPEELAAAGMGQSAPDGLKENIAMYRYNSDGDYLEYVDAVHDQASMTVTAVITKPGQYVLAADSAAPHLASLELSDYREKPTITARIDDLSGLDVSKFVFELDGNEKVNGGSILQYYSAQTGLFTYTVTEALAEGEHTVAFTLADTAGNSETYTYSFRVDLTAPVIEQLSVAGATNRNSRVEIRAKVFDENLETVHALLARQNTDGTWSPYTPAEMVLLEDGTWALDYEGDGASLRIYVQAADIAGNIAKSEVEEAKPFVAAVQIAEEYIVLRKGQKHTLTVSVTPGEFASEVTWSTEDDTVLQVDENGVVTGRKEGTAYVTASVCDGENTLSARVRVDVTEALTIDGVQLSSKKVTTELYKNEYATFEILLKLPQNYSTQAENAAAVENRGVAIESARFTDETMAKYFDLVVLDDRTVRIVPTAEALANAKAVKGSYKGTVTVIVDGESYETEMLTLSVKKTLPKLKASIAAFNSFYAGQSQPIVITGGTVTGITLDGSKKQPDWLTLEKDVLTLNGNAPRKNVSGKLYLLVETEEWAVPAALNLSVKNTYKVPGVKLATTSVTVSNQSGPAEVELKLLCTNKADTLSGLNITGINAPEGYYVENFNEADGTFTLKAAEGFKAGKVELKVTFGNVTNTLKLTVKTQAVKLKLGSTKVSLNKDLKDVASVEVNCLTAGYDVTAPVLTYDNQMLEVQYADGKLTVSAKAAAYGKTYPVTIRAYEGAPAVKLNVAILRQNVVVKSTIKAKGNLDVIRSGSAITVTPSYTNVLNVDVDENAVLKIYSSADKFKVPVAEVKAEDGIFTIDKSVISDQTLKYKAQLETVIGAATIKSNLISLTVKMGTAKLTVKTEDTTLFAKDKNDRALVWFEAADTTLNDIAEVAFKNAKQANMFELIDYADGTWAIGFKDGKVDKILIGKTVTVALNVFIEGNQTAKANTTVNVKLTIVK